LPVAFAQVREDPLLDLWVVDRLGGDARVALIASGGCTATLVAAAPKVAWLHLIDPNPAQLALSRLKLRLLQTSAPADRLALLGHASLPAEERHSRLGAEMRSLGLPPDMLGPVAFVAEVGPDQAGRYECVFAELRKGLDDQAGALEAVLRLTDPAEQERRVAPATPLGRRLDAVLDTVMALPNLVRLFGEEATKNPVEPFARHFARRLRHVLATLPAQRNPYLWQMLRGRYPEGGVAPWLTAPAPARWPRVTWVASFMTEALAAAPASFDFVHLSNILDWLAPEKPRRPEPPWSWPGRPCARGGGRSFASSTQRWTSRTWDESLTGSLPKRMSCTRVTAASSTGRYTWGGSDDGASAP
jgi:S-adenosylmethionine-diacylglycerol 3-amino-3-carboxypropyl transferase